MKAHSKTKNLVDFFGAFFCVFSLLTTVTLSLVDLAIPPIKKAHAIDVSSIYEQPFGNDGWLYEATKGNDGKTEVDWGGNTVNGDGNGVVNQNGTLGVNGLTDISTKLKFGKGTMPMGAGNDTIGYLGDDPVSGYQNSSSSASWRVLAVGSVPAQSTTKGYSGSYTGVSAANYGVSTPVAKNEALIVLDDVAGKSPFNGVEKPAGSIVWSCGASEGKCANSYEGGNLSNAFVTWSNKYFSTTEVNSVVSETINGVCSVSDGCVGTNGKAGASSGGSTTNTGQTTTPKAFYPLSYGDVAGMPSSSSTDGASNTTGVFFTTNNDKKAASSNYYLRSPHPGNSGSTPKTSSWVVNNTGDLALQSANVAVGVRPSAKLNLDKILLTQQDSPYVKVLTLANTNSTETSINFGSTTITSPSQNFAATKAEVQSKAQSQQINVGSTQEIELSLNSIAGIPQTSGYNNVGYKIVDNIDGSVVGIGDGRTLNGKVILAPVCNYPNLTASADCSNFTTTPSQNAVNNNTKIVSGQSYKILNLQHTYDIYVWGQKNGNCAASVSSSSSCSNEASVPAVAKLTVTYGAVKNFNATAGDGRAILEWDTPDYPKGMIDSTNGGSEFRPFDAYEVSCKGDWSDTLTINRVGLEGADPDLYPGNNTLSKHYQILCGTGNDLSEIVSSKYFAGSNSGVVYGGDPLLSDESLVNGVTYTPKVRVKINDTSHGGESSVSITPNVVQSILPNQGNRYGGEQITVTGDFEKLGAKHTVSANFPLLSRRIDEAAVPDKIKFINSADTTKTHDYILSLATLETAIFTVDSCSSLNSGQTCATGITANMEIYSSGGIITNANLPGIGYDTTGQNRKVIHNDAYKYLGASSRFLNSDNSDITIAKSISVDANGVIQLNAKLCTSLESSDTVFNQCLSGNDIEISFTNLDIPSISYSWNIKTETDGVFSQQLTQTQLSGGQYQIVLTYNGTSIIAGASQIFEFYPYNTIPIVKITNTTRSENGANVLYNLSEKATLYFYLSATCVTNKNVIKNNATQITEENAATNIGQAFVIADQNARCLSILAVNENGYESSMEITPDNIPIGIVDAYNKILSVTQNGSSSNQTTKITFSFQYPIDLTRSDLSFIGTVGFEDFDAVFSTPSSSVDKKVWEFSVSSISMTALVNFVIDVSSITIVNYENQVDIYAAPTVITVSNLQVYRSTNASIMVDFESTYTGKLLVCFTAFDSSVCNTFVDSSFNVSIGSNQFEFTVAKLSSLGLSDSEIYGLGKLYLKVQNGVDSNTLNNSYKAVSRLIDSNPITTNGIRDTVSTSIIEVSFKNPTLLGLNDDNGAIIVSTSVSSPISATLSTPYCKNTQTTDIECLVWNIPINNLSGSGNLKLLFTGATYPPDTDNYLLYHFFDSPEQIVPVEKDITPPSIVVSTPVRDSLISATFDLSINEIIPNANCLIAVTDMSITEANIPTSSWGQCPNNPSVANQPFTQTLYFQDNDLDSRPHKIWIKTIDALQNSGSESKAQRTVSGWAQIDSLVTDGVAKTVQSTKITVTLHNPLPVASMSGYVDALNFGSTAFSFANMIYASISSINPLDLDSNGYASVFELILSGVNISSGSVTVDVSLEQVTNYRLVTSAITKGIRIYDDILPPLIKIYPITRNTTVDQSIMTFDSNEAGYMTICVLPISAADPSAYAGIQSCSGGKKISNIQIMKSNSQTYTLGNTLIGNTQNNSDSSEKKIFIGAVDNRGRTTPVIKYDDNMLQNDYQVANNSEFYPLKHILKPYSQFTSATADNGSNGYTQSITLAFNFPVELNNNSIITSNQVSFKKSSPDLIWVCQDYPIPAYNRCYQWKAEVNTSYTGNAQIVLNSSLLEEYDFPISIENRTKTVYVAAPPNAAQAQINSYSRDSTGTTASINFQISQTTNVWGLCSNTDQHLDPQTVDFSSWYDIGQISSGSPTDFSCPKASGDTDIDARGARYIYIGTSYDDGLGNGAINLISTTVVPQYITWGNLRDQKFGPSSGINGVMDTSANIVPLGQIVNDYGTANEEVISSTTGIRFGFSTPATLLQTVATVYGTNITDAGVDLGVAAYLRLKQGSTNSATINNEGVGTGVLSKETVSPFNQLDEYYRLGFNVVSPGNIKICMRIDNNKFMGTGTHALTNQAVTNVTEDCSGDIPVFKNVNSPIMTSITTNHYDGKDGTKVKISYSKATAGKYCYIITDSSATSATGSQTDDQDLSKLITKASANCFTLNLTTTNDSFDINLPSLSDSFSPKKIWVLGYNESEYQNDPTNTNFSLVNQKIKGYLVFDRSSSMSTAAHDHITTDVFNQYKDTISSTALRLSFYGLNISDLPFNNILDVELLDGDNLGPEDIGKATITSQSRSLDITSCYVSVGSKTQLCLPISTLSQGRVGIKISLKTSAQADYELGNYWGVGSDNYGDNLASNQIVNASSYWENRFVGGFGLNNNNISSGGPSDDGFTMYSSWVTKDADAPTLSNVSVNRTDLSSSADVMDGYKNVSFGFNVNEPGKVAYYIVSPGNPNPSIYPINGDLSGWQNINIASENAGVDYQVQLSNFPYYNSVNVCFVAIDSDNNLSDSGVPICRQIRAWSKLINATQLNGSHLTATTTDIKLTFSRPVENIGLSNLSIIPSQTDGGSAVIDTISKNTDTSLGATDGTVWIVGIDNVIEGKIDIGLGVNLNNSNSIPFYSIANPKISDLQIYQKTSNVTFALNSIMRTSYTNSSVGYSISGSSSSSYNLYYQIVQSNQTSCSAIPSGLTFGVDGSSLQNGWNYGGDLTNTTGIFDLLLSSSVSASVQNLSKVCAFVVNDNSISSDVASRNIPNYFKLLAVSQYGGEGTIGKVGGEVSSTVALRLDLNSSIDLNSMVNSGIATVIISDTLYDSSHLQQAASGNIELGDIDLSGASLRKSAAKWTQEIALRYGKVWGDGPGEVNSNTPLCDINVNACQFWVYDNLSIQKSGYISALVQFIGNNIQSITPDNAKDEWIFKRDSSIYDNHDEPDCWKPGGSCKIPDDIPVPPGGKYPEDSYNNPDGPNFYDGCDINPPQLNPGVTTALGGGCDNDGDGKPNVNDPDSPNYYWPDGGGGDEDGDGIDNKDDAKSKPCYITGGSCVVDESSDPIYEPPLLVQQNGTIYFVDINGHDINKPWTIPIGQNCNNGCSLSITLEDSNPLKHVTVSMSSMGFIQPSTIRIRDEDVPFFDGMHTLFFQSSFGEKRRVKVYNPNVVYQGAYKLNGRASETIDLPGTDEVQGDYGSITAPAANPYHKGPFTPGEAVCFRALSENSNSNNSSSWSDFGCSDNQMVSDQDGNIKISLPPNTIPGVYQIYGAGQNSKVVVVWEFLVKDPLLFITVHIKGKGITDNNDALGIEKGGERTINFTPDAKHVVTIVLLDGVPESSYSQSSSSYLIGNPPTSFTLKNIEKSHIVTVIFEPIRNNCGVGNHWDEEVYNATGDGCVKDPEIPDTPEPKPPEPVDPPKPPKPPTVPDKIGVDDDSFQIIAKDQSKAEKGYDIVVKWKPPYDGGSAITNYYISIKNVWGKVFISNYDNKTSNTYTLKNVPIGQYIVTLSAKNAVGENQKSTKNGYAQLNLGSHDVFRDIGKLKKSTLAYRQRYDDIIWLAKTGVTVGSNCPGKNCAYNHARGVTRGAMADFMYKLMGQTKKGDLSKVSKWFKKEKDMQLTIKTNEGRYEHILWVAREGITTGCTWSSTGTPTGYCPSRIVNRGAMAEFMYHLAGDPDSLNPGVKDKKRPDENHVKPSEVADVEKIFAKDKDLLRYKNPNGGRYNINRYYDILWLIKYNIAVGDVTSSGKPIGMYKPENIVNRGAMAQFMKKLYYVILTKKPVPASGIVPDVIQ